ncbi:MAG: hypothetical protein C0183_11775 [Roseiflexus castenholzii]|nr:MAG: hypothetical protein C0183_11775 [Roseiflexus castenholzii]
MAETLRRCAIIADCLRDQAQGERRERWQGVGMDGDMPQRDDQARGERREGWQVGARGGVPVSMFQVAGTKGESGSLCTLCASVV